VHVHVLPPVETREWTVEDLDANVERVRDLFVRMHEEIGCA
jgi:hypothetical protein